MEIHFDRTKQYIDVRSESEYAKGHISGAINLPILYDEERSEVGYIYKQVSVDAAKRAGVKYASAKLDAFYETVKQLCEKHGEDAIVFYCARGGYRSQSVSLFFEGLQIHAHKLAGGYKAYRNMVLESLDRPPDSYPKFIGINGLTGSEKTKILERLEQAGEPVLHLERAARHKGSNLGKIGMSLPQCAQQFENDLFTELLRAEKKGYCFVEMESRKIGKLLVPLSLYTAYHENPLAVIWIENPMERRIRFLMEDYRCTPNFEAELDEGLERIKRYLPTFVRQLVTKHREEKRFAELTEVLLEHYYDPLYRKSTASSQKDLILVDETPENAVRRILEWKETVGTKTREREGSSP